MEVCAAEEGLQPVDAYHPPLAVAVDVATYAQFSPIPAEDDLAHAQNPELFNPYKRWNFHKFSRYRAKVKMETELAHNRYRDRVQNHLANDPKAFWSYIRLKKGNSNQYKILKDGQVLSGGECAEEYARYFQTVYNTEPPTLSAEAASSTTSPSSGYYKLEVRREVALATYLFKVLRGKTHNPALLEELRLCVPDEYVWRRRRPRLLVVPCARTNLLQKAPLTRALRTLNTIADRMDLFSCTLNEFTRVTYEVVVKSSYNL
ncbi:hypothetical protein SFRURICE_011171 [Spodoptera frugiperda]|nr:hypothetical protein SFRURICE_011171 [Spodoptera frugiperda]